MLASFWRFFPDTLLPFASHNNSDLRNIFWNYKINNLVWNSRKNIFLRFFISGNYIFVYFFSQIFVVPFSSTRIQRTPRLGYCQFSPTTSRAFIWKEKTNPPKLSHCLGSEMTDMTRKRKINNCRHHSLVFS